jgi:hypothetical protein
MRLGAVVGGILAAGGALAAWLWAQGHRDPKQWPQDIAAEFSQLLDDAKASLSAGRRAATRKGEEIDREIEEARTSASGSSGGA